MYPPPQSNDRNEKKPDNDKPEMPDAMKDLLKTVREKKPCMTVIANGADPSPEELSMMLAMTMRDLMRDNKMLVSGGRTVMALYEALKKEHWISSPRTRPGPRRTKWRSWRRWSKCIPNRSAVRRWRRAKNATSFGTARERWREIARRAARTTWGAATTPICDRKRAKIAMPKAV